MKKLLLPVLAFLASLLPARADVSLEQCISAAEENYPLIKKYDLLTATQEIELSDINKGWLPRISLYAQGTGQNVVPSFPATLSDIMEKMGGEIRGLGKFQYKIGLDLNQTIWDGGASKARREITRQKETLNHAALDVDMYAIRSRVQSIYFGILLIESQISQTEDALQVYQANLDKLHSLVRNGAAMQADADMVEAQMLALDQNLTQARAALKGYRDMLSIYTATDLSSETLSLPSAEIPTDLNPARPELTLLEHKAALNNAQRSLTDVSLMPKIGLFAQTYYGYPGIDYFKAMMGRDLTFNLLAGVKVSWNIDAFYTKKNSLRSLDIANQEIEADKETFLFNTGLQTASQTEEIEGLRSLMKNDKKIVSLRQNVRRAAESQLANGVIDATALITKINDENQAILASSLHSIQYLQAIYNLKNTLNR